jgi:hypothetical protein
MLAGCLTTVVIGAQGTPPQSTPPPPRTVEAAEAEGAKHPKITLPEPEGAQYAEAFGPRERKCVDVGKHPAVRSGDFVAGPFQERIFMAGSEKRKLWWSPRQMPATPLLQLRATRIGSPDVVASFTFGQTARPVALADVQAFKDGTGPRPVPTGPSFFPTQVHFPQAGNWLVVVTSGDNWGCFILDEI